LDLLRDFFMSKLLNRGISLERREQIADEWTARLQSEGHLSVRPVEISEELFDELTFGRAAQMRRLQPQC